jgi:hypothetical protein
METANGAGLLAEVVLNDHRRAPDKAFYDLDRLGSMFTPEDVRRLDEAYGLLVTKGLVEPSGSGVRWFSALKPLYRLTEKGRVMRRSA